MFWYLYGSCFQNRSPNSVDNVGEGVGHGVNNGLHKHVGDIFDAGGLWGIINYLSKEC